jgi:hypothetical protein
MNGKTLIGLAVLALALSAQAEVHRCKDEAGKTYFSDRGCPNGEKMRGAPGGAAHTIGTPAGDQEVAQRCLEQYRTRTGNGTADSTRVASHRFKWVSVRDVGARRLCNITIAFRDPAGNWSETDRHDCLLRGDNVTFQTTSYELVN